MAPSKAVKLPIARRIQQRLDEMFKDRDIRVPDPEHLPSYVDKRRNAQVEDFNKKHRVVADFFVAKTMNAWVKTKLDRCKDEMCKLLEIDPAKLEPGQDFTASFDNVVLNYKCTNAQMRIDIDALRTALVTHGKLSVDTAERCIELARVEGKKPLHLRPSTNTE